MTYRSDPIVTALVGARRPVAVAPVLSEGVVSSASTLALRYLPAFAGPTSTLVLWTWARRHARHSGHPFTCNWTIEAQQFGVAERVLGQSVARLEALDLLTIEVDDSAEARILVPTRFSLSLRSLSKLPLDLREHYRTLRATYEQVA